MSSLTGNLISSTYQSLLKIGTNNTASANLNNVTDGAGNTTSLYIATAATAVSGTFAVLGSMIVSGVLAATSSNATSASYALSSSFAQTASFVTLAQTASFVTNAITLNSTASAIFAITGSNTFTGTQVVSGSLRLFESASFTLPTSQPSTAVAGTAFFSGSFLYIYNGTAYKSASFN
jgi:hypothetical protein